MQPTENDTGRKDFPMFVAGSESEILEQLSSVLSSLNSLADLENAAALVSQKLRMPFYMLILYFSSASSSASASSPSQVFANYPDAWLRKHGGREYAAIGPVLKWAQRYAVPFSWSELAVNDLSGRAMLCEAAGHGIADGVTASAKTTDVTLAVLSLAAERSLSPIASMQARAYLHWLCAHLLDHAITLTSIQAGARVCCAPRLSARERQCLELAAQGFTTGRIASQLGIAASTVTFFVNNSMRKLGVHSRAAAIG